MKVFASGLLFLLGFQMALTAISKSHVVAGQNRNTSQTVETGKFRFYETKQIRGEETYQLQRADNGEVILSAKTDLPFVGEEKAAAKHNAPNES